MNTPTCSVILPFNELSQARQKALLALSGMRRRAEDAMNNAQFDHGMQSKQWGDAATRYETATELYTDYTARFRMPEHPSYVYPESSEAYDRAILTCTACGSDLGVAPDGKLVCPHIACCNLNSIPV